MVSDICAPPQRNHCLSGPTAVVTALQIEDMTDDEVDDSDAMTV